MKKVFVSGCYDMLHSGHVAFFEEAATYGELYVGIGSDRTVNELKARKTVYSENERLYIVKALRAVKDAWINRGSGMLDFEEELRHLQPDIFFVNSDGHSPLKENLCKQLGIEYVVSQRVPHQNLPPRSTTALRQECDIPYRIELAGGWLDQPFVNRLYPGAVLTASVEPDYEFNDRSGMSTSSRKKAIELWQAGVPTGDKEQLARMLFCYENPPGTKYVSGSQDSLGIVLPGLNRLYYANDFWPEKIDSVTDPAVLSWVESHLWLVPLFPRHVDYDVLSETYITAVEAEKLSKAADRCWEAMLAGDLEAWGQATIDTFDAQIAMFPRMVSQEILATLAPYQSAVKGWKLTGAGGGGYLVILNDKPVENAIQIRIRR